MRHRNMYNLTGQPGWMRFGYSPGWVGRSPTGLGPCASYLMTGEWPVPQAQMGPPTWGASPNWAPTAGGQPVPWGPPAGWTPPAPAPEQEKQWLASQADRLQQQLDQINARLAELTSQATPE
jgi:hypothetical protein